MYSWARVGPGWKLGRTPRFSRDAAHSIYTGEIVELAKEHEALLVGAEHRFYGSSLNDDGLQLEELQYLSSQQAYVLFIKI